MNRDDGLKGVSAADSMKMGLNFLCMAGYHSQLWFRDAQFVGWRYFRQLPVLIALGLPFLFSGVGGELGTPDPICIGYGVLTALLYLVRLVQTRKNRGRMHPFDVGKCHPVAETIVGTLLAAVASFVSPPLSVLLGLSTIGNAAGTAALGLRNTLAADEMAAKVFEAENIHGIYERDYRNR